MRNLAQLNQKTRRHLGNLAALLTTLSAVFTPRVVRSINGIVGAHSGRNRAAHKVERQNVRYARMHNRKGSNA